MIRPDLENTLRQLTSEEHKALGVFKAMELTNALGSKYGYQDSDKMFTVRLLQEIRYVIRKRVIYLEGLVYNLDTPALGQLLDRSLKLFYMGMKDVNSEEWVELQRLSDLIVNNYTKYTFSGLYTLYAFTPGYPKSLLFHVLDYIQNTKARTGC